MSELPGVDGFLIKVDALYKVEAGHQWYLQVSTVQVRLLLLFIYVVFFDDKSWLLIYATNLMQFSICFRYCTALDQAAKSHAFVVR